MASFTVRQLGAFLLSALLVACGGGGGSGGSTNNSGPGGNEPASVTGLVPTAPPLGATLVGDASTLRPLISGATWGYAGTDTLNGSTTTYTNTVAQTASGSTIAETTSNAFNGGADTATISASTGTITSSTLTSLTGGTAQQITYPELRSPVRQNDQVTVLDQHFADIGGDSDGDGKHDSGDLGIYRVVVGMDDVALPNGATQRAVRVDMIAMARVTLSSSGMTSPATQVALQSTWYAPGIGIVKQRLTTPVSAASNEVVEEVLTYFDGVTKGFGAKPATLALVPADATTSAGQALQSVNEVVAFPDHAVVVGSFIDALGTSRTAISSIDLNGKVTHTGLYTGVPASGFRSVGNQLVAVVPPGDINQHCQVQFIRFDANGVRPTDNSTSVINFAPPAGQTTCVDITQLMFANDGDRLWLAMTRHSLNSSGWVTDLLVQSFDANGTPLTDETKVLSVNRLLTENVSLNPGLALKSIGAAGGKVYISYITDKSGSVNLASLTSAGLQKQSTLSLDAWTRGVPTLLATPSAGALLWAGPSDIVTGLAPAMGVLLDASLAPVLSSGGSSLGAQSLSTQVRACGVCNFVRNGTGDSLLIGEIGASTGKSLTMNFSNFKTDIGAIAAQKPSQLQLSLTDVSVYESSISQYQFVPIADRVVALVVANRQLYTKVGWLQ